MPQRLPPLESLRVFEACARHGNFSRAADELNVSPTAVSQRIRTLEDELGRILFARHGPRIALTEAGHALARQIGEAMTLMRAAVDACRGSVAALRVSVTPTFAQRWLLPRLSAYQQREDASAIRLDVNTELRAADRFDLAVRSGRSGWPAFDCEALLPILRTPMLSPQLLARQRPTRPAELARLPLLRDPNWPAWFRQAGASVEALSFAAVEFDTQDMAAAAAARGAGVALLSPLLFADMLAAGTLVQPFADVLAEGEAYYLLCHRDDARPEVHHFAQWLRAEAAAVQAVG